MRIKAYGYNRKARGQNQPIELREVTFVGDVDALRRVAQHILAAADLIVKHSTDFGHSHLRDEWKEWSDSDVDVIVQRTIVQREP